MNLKQEIARLKAQWTPPPTVPTVAPMSPLELWQRAMGCDPDPWQRLVLESSDPRIALLCCRQSGKSQTTAIKSLSIALNESDSLILLVSRSLRQSGELARKVFSAYRAVGRAQVPAEAETTQTLQLSNGSRILALPGGDPESLRGFSSVRMICLDEAARIPDPLWASVRPMIAVNPRGALLVLSTPYGKRGFFHRIFTHSQRWLKITITATDCPRLTREFLQEEWIELGERWFKQEYLCMFVEAIGQVFSDVAIDAAFRDDIAPLFGDEDRGDDDEVLVNLPALFGAE